MPAGATSLLPDLSNMHAFDHPYSSLQWQHYTVPVGFINTVFDPLNAQ